ncbi:MAG: hypothetical protein ACE5Z5_09425 [Candidatus Bathyarchaeia archaeon]
MTDVRRAGDRALGERILCEYRRSTRPILIHKAGAHRAQRITIWGNPAVCLIVKEWRTLK